MVKRMNHDSKAEKLMVLQIRILLNIAYVVARGSVPAIRSDAYADFDRLRAEFRKILEEG